MWGFRRAGQLFLWSWSCLCSRFGPSLLVFRAGVSAGCAGCDAARSAALEAGGRRYPLLTLTLTLTLTLILAFVVPACAVTGGAVPDLAPPGPHDGGVRSGTVEPASRRVAVLAGAA